MNTNRNPAVEGSPFDQQTLRRALGNFVTGVTIVTTLDELRRPRGLTANSFTSVSLEPPLVLVCIATGADSCAAFRQCQGFTINVLSEDQRATSDLFATKSPDKFAHVNWIAGTTGAPRILGSLAILDCRIHERIDAGDHLVLIGRVEALDTTAQRPLVYGQGGYISLSVQQAAVAQPAGRSVVVSCIAEFEGRIVLVRHRQSGGWTLPGAVLTETGSGELVSLQRALQHIGAKGEITFLYSVFEDATAHAVNIVYRGTLSETLEDRADARLFSEDEIPWDDLKPDQCAGMLGRFYRERALDQFGIYTDIGGEPRVARLGQQPASWDAYITEIGGN